VDGTMCVNEQTPPHAARRLAWTGLLSRHEAPTAAGGQPSTLVHISAERKIR
jgi:hypothetical protein